MCHDFYEFHDFSTFRADCTRLRGHKILKIVSKRRATVVLSCIEAEITPVERFYDLSVSGDLPSKSENRESCENHGTNFFEL